MTGDFPPPRFLVVLPVFNEEASLPGVVQTWAAALQACEPDFVILAIDDGSTDRSAAILTELQNKLRSRLEVLSQKNIGHGQTCLRGYHIAAQRQIPFILQIDSDGQCDPHDFPKFWDARTRFDVIYGMRNARQDGWRRIVASKILQLVLLLRTRVWCRDANVPFRLMRTSAIASKLALIPEDFCLVNIALAVLLRRDANVREGGYPINFRPRHGGEPSVPLSRFAHKAAELWHQLGQLPQ